MILPAAPVLSRRRAYTLLEVIIATAICVLLLAAVFTALEMETRHMQAGRDVSEQSSLARALLDRIGSDIMHSLTPVAPVFYPSLSSSPASAGTSSSAISSSSSSSQTAPSSSSSSPTTNSTYQFDFGLQGDSSKLTLFSCGLPPTPDPQRTESAGDLRFITYWLAQGNQGLLGLARLELTRVTADEAGQVPASGSAEEAACVIAEEVKALGFRYLDKTGWNAAWDGTATGPDFVTLIGPPRAVEIRLSMVDTNPDRRPNTKPRLRVYRHVVAVPTAPR